VKTESYREAYNVSKESKCLRNFKLKYYLVLILEPKNELVKQFQDLILERIELGK
jgi:hypothetical protein